MIDFPATPIVGQTFTSGGQSWTWDGMKWVAYGVAQGVYLPLSGGKLTGALNPAGGIIGVTDGSSAAPGMVGEVLTANGPVTALTSLAWATVKSMNLTPGDWDVWGTVQITLSGGSVGSQLQASVSLTPASNGAPYPSNGVMTSIVVAGLGGGVLPVSAVAFSVAVTTPVYLNALAMFSSGTSSTTANSFIMARRAR
jgi:hypothetical protein